MKIINKLILFFLYIIVLVFLFPLVSIAENSQLNSKNLCDMQCQQHIQSMLDTYRLQHRILAMQMSIGMPDHSIIHFNSGTLTDPTIDKAAKNVDSTSLFKINSITKTFTATIIFQLEDEGKLSTNDTIGKWFPNQYPQWKNITIDQMLHMTSGIYEYGLSQNFWAYISQDWSRIWTTPELIDFGYYNRFNQDPYPWFSPYPFQSGHIWNYSNTNYILLTRIIELASGKSYQTNLYDRIINNPAIGLNKNTILYDPDNSENNPEKLKDMVHAYMKSDDITAFPISIERGAGGIISNTENLVKWLDAFFDGKVLRPNALTKMTSVVCEDDEGIGDCASINSQGNIIHYNPGDPMPNNQLTNNGYSSGFSSAIYPKIDTGEFIWLSNGGDPGYQSQTVYFKNSKMIFALMENKMPESGHEADVENFIFDIKKYISTT